MLCCAVTPKEVRSGLLRPKQTVCANDDDMVMTTTETMLCNDDDMVMTRKQ